MTHFITFADICLLDSHIYRYLTFQYKLFTVSMVLFVYVFVWQSFLRKHFILSCDHKITLGVICISHVRNFNHYSDVSHYVFWKWIIGSLIFVPVKLNQIKNNQSVYVKRKFTMVVINQTLVHAFLKGNVHCISTIMSVKEKGIKVLVLILHIKWIYTSYFN